MRYTLKSIEVYGSAPIIQFFLFSDLVGDN